MKPFPKLFDKGNHRVRSFVEHPILLNRQKKKKKGREI